MNQAHRAVGKRRAAEQRAVSGPRPTFDGGRAAQRRVAEAGRVGDRRLRRVPVGSFLVVLGLAGLSSAWLRANQVWGAPEWIARVLFWLALVAFALVALLYAGKWLRHPAAARAELARPGALPLVAGPTTSVLVLAAAGADSVSGPARALWWVGALAHLVITVWVTDAFFVRPASAHERSAPVWLLPAVGALAMPLAARAVGSVELAWVGFGAGVVLWLGLWPSLASRPWAEPAGPVGPAGQAVPNGPDGDVTTRALFVAAPATAMWAWQSLTGGVDDPVGRG